MRYKELHYWVEQKMVDPNKTYSFKEYLQNSSTDTISRNFTIRDMKHVKENEPAYFKELLRNDYKVCDKIHGRIIITS